MLYVPVISKSGKPLMAFHPARARELVRKGFAIRRFLQGIFYIKLTKRETGETQPVAAGVDPGSKKEGITVMSAKRTFLNIQNDAVTHVKKAVEAKRVMRRCRRQRKTPCRKPRFNRKGRGLPPSTCARWQIKLNICKTLAKLYPITTFVVEDIAAKTRPGQRKWNRSFSPLEAGKKRFYEELGKLATVVPKKGYETKKIRDKLGLKKSSNKLSDKFEAHCVDSWCLAWSASILPKQTRPENTKVLLIKQNVVSRRQLHMKQPVKRFGRRRYGGTRILGFKKGSLVKHKKEGICIIGGYTGNKIRLNNRKTGKRLKGKYSPKDCIFLAYNAWIMKWN